MRRFITILLAMLALAPAHAATILLRPARVFDGTAPIAREGRQVLVEGDRIAAVGRNLAAPAGARIGSRALDSCFTAISEPAGESTCSKSL